MPSDRKRRRRRAAWQASAWLAAGAGLFLSVGSGVAVAEYAVGNVNPVYAMPSTVVDSWTPAPSSDDQTTVAATDDGGMAANNPGLAYVESPPVFQSEPASSGDSAAPDIQPAVLTGSEPTDANPQI